jgi:hypothetical protein
VEVSTDDGETWEEAEYLDPRTINQFAPPGGTDPTCDAAARMAAALEEIVTAILTALDGGAIAADVGALIILWLALFAGFAVLLALAVAVGAVAVSIGYTDLFTAFDGFDWPDFACNLKCYLGADGFLTETAYQAFRDDYLSTLTATQETLLVGILSVTGFAALNDFAATREETGDCSGCSACGWSHTLYADSPELEWWFPFQWNLSCARASDGWYGQHGATESDGAGHLRWIDTPRTGTAYWLGLAGRITLPEGSTLTSINWNSVQTVGGNLDGWAKWRQVNATKQCWTNFYTGYNAWAGSLTGPLDVTWELNWWNNSANGYRVRINSITISGTGVDPLL